VFAVEIILARLFFFVSDRKIFADVNEHEDGKENGIHACKCGARVLNWGGSQIGHFLT